VDLMVEEEVLEAVELGVFFMELLPFLVVLIQ
jgi:hypothetical protein